MTRLRARMLWTSPAFIVAAIVAMVVCAGLTPALSGIATGVPATMLLTRLMGGLLHQAASRTIDRFVLVPPLFPAIALSASYMAARRVTQVNPAETLRRNRLPQARGPQRSGIFNRAGQTSRSGEGPTTVNKLNKLASNVEVLVCKKCTWAKGDGYG